MENAAETQGLMSSAEGFEDLLIHRTTTTSTTTLTTTTTPLPITNTTPNPTVPVTTTKKPKPTHTTHEHTTKTNRPSTTPGQQPPQWTAETVADLEDGIQEKYSATITVEYKIHEGSNLPASHLPVYQPAPQLRWEMMLEQWESAMSRILEISADKLPEATSTQQTKPTESTTATPATTKPPPYDTPYCNLQMELDRYCSRMSRFGDGEFNCPRAEGFEGQMVARFGLNKSGKQSYENEYYPLKDNFCQSLTADSCQNVAGYEGKMLARFGPGPPGTKNNWRCYGEFKETNEQKACLDENGEKSVENCSDPDPVPGTFCYNGRLQEIIKEIRDGACPEVLEKAAVQEVSTTTAFTTETEEIIETDFGILIRK
ncbi:Oidioi.mRNA.OKI2018_I69.chr1.g679.t1.cds [Oikopleura dioica]|uniref:Oidioi.mRNA.OKI2018_I69.chr1.g679.t1.cds n=1 Tax=Oikopleura dioica TaxID=34765 RepID=A0ABN7SKL7_OIKDI|nr:Oidioi.mRNA.OKI2018_I69.chr1.g679.t1.cds [Oikopleura dioica]